MKQRTSHWGMRTTALPLLLVLFFCATAGPVRAATVVIGSPLSVPATLNTAENLGYSGSNIQVGESLFHMYHDGADTVLWNAALPAGAVRSPATGQIILVRLEGCAVRPAGAPAPLTQIHFQDLSPLPEGGAIIYLSTGPMEIPVCGVDGAGGSTITTYTPVNLCTRAGDYVAFNDEGGFVPNESGPPPYPAGVPYLVIGSTAGATMDSFIRNGGTTNGKVMAPTDTTYHDGFAVSNGEELMLQATVGTGPDANPECGGTHGVVVRPKEPPLPPVRIGPQTDGINHLHIAAIAMFCRLAGGCSGTMQLSPAASAARRGAPAHAQSLRFSIRGGTTVHVSVRVSEQVFRLARRDRRGVPMKLTASVAGKVVSQTVVLRIF